MKIAELKMTEHFGCRLVTTAMFKLRALYFYVGLEITCNYNIGYKNHHNNINSIKQGIILESYVP